MTGNDIENDIQDEEDYLQSYFSFGVIIRADYPTIHELKKYLEEKKIVVAYHKLSTNRLYIQEENKS